MLSLEEFDTLTEFLSDVERGVVVFGSARQLRRTPMYDLAYEIGFQLAKHGITVITGGGPGIMEAANNGAYDAQGQSIGINIVLPNEQFSNPYTTKAVTVDSFSVRKELFIRLGRGFIILPGGFGTIDELTDILTLSQTGKMKPSPVALLNTSFWHPLLDWFSNSLLKESYISPNDLNQIKLFDETAPTIKYITRVLEGKTDEY
jgi:uncharacterized protein (TIGR00730 family)